jgi:hypothetical protein
MITDELIHAENCALALYAFSVMHPEAEQAYRRFYSDNPAKNLTQAGVQFSQDRNPAPVIAVIQKTYKRLRYLAAPAGNHN